MIKNTGRSEEEKTVSSGQEGSLGGPE